MKNTITKAEIYSAIKNIVANGTTEGVDNAMLDAILERMDKDIDATKKSSTKKETDNDRLNKEIQEFIITTLTEQGTMVYADFVKTVQGAYDVSPQKITANVTKIKSLVDKFEDGKGKNKKLYIRLA